MMMLAGPWTMAPWTLFDLIQGKCAVADRGGGARGHRPLDPVKLSHKKMATEDGRIDFMFLAPPHPAAGSATGVVEWKCHKTEM